METPGKSEEATQNLCDLIRAFKEHLCSILWENARGKSLSCFKCPGWVHAGTKTLPDCSSGSSDAWVHGAMAGGSSPA